MPGESRWLLRIQVFVASVPPEDDDARAVRAVEAAAGRFPGQVEVEALPLDGPEGSELGLQMSPTVMAGGMAISVGGPISAGRLKRYIEAQLNG